MKHLHSLTLFIIPSVFIFLLGCGGIPFVDKSKQEGIFKEKTIYVYPVHILRESSSFDVKLSDQIVRIINTVDNMKAESFDKPIGVNSQWEMNEAKMFMKSFNAFSESVKADSEKVEFALLVEILYQPNMVVGVHYYLLDNKEGKAVMAHIINSHNEHFQRINPKSIADGLEVFKAVFEEDMKELKK